MAAIVQPQQNKKIKSWPPSHKFGGPCQCNAKIRYIQPERPISFKPITSFKPTDSKLSDNTTYKMSYYGHDPNIVRRCRGTPKIAKENLVSSGDFSSDTTHKMSYGAWPGFMPPPKYKPTDHRLMGDGPMSELTTHKHDYTAKPLQEVERIIHSGNLGFSPEPMEDKTTNNMSYQFPDMNRFEKPKSFKPHSSFNPPSSKMDDKTTHKMSYQPFCPPEKEVYPWTQKDKYRPPTVPFDAGTVYNGSFFAPGQFVEEVDGPGICCCTNPQDCFASCGGPPKAHEFDTCPCDLDPTRPPPISPAGAAVAESGGRNLNVDC